MVEMKLSIVLPAYNEGLSLEETVLSTISCINNFSESIEYEVIISEDGCTDGTPDIASNLAESYDSVRHIHSESRLGRGRALERAFERANGEILVYFDTDLATDMNHLEELVDAIRVDGYDIATGSRYIPGKEATRPTVRKIPSRVYNFLVRVMFNSEVRDHQCGFKSVSFEAFKALQSEIEDEHWFWDTELLVRAQRHDMRIKEFSVNWESKGDSKVNLVNDIYDMGTQLGRLWWDLNINGKYNRIDNLSNAFHSLRYKSR